MATSSKVMFKLETLKEKALESINFRIHQKMQELASYDDDSVMEERIREWRTRQEARISDLFSRLGEGGIGDHQLAKWKIEEIPTLETYERNRVGRDLQQLEATRSRIVAKSESLVPDENGNISLTKTQLDEFFGL